MHTSKNTTKMKNNSADKSTQFVTSISLLSAVSLVVIDARDQLEMTGNQLDSLENDFFQNSLIFCQLGDEPCEDKYEKNFRLQKKSNDHVPSIDVY
jgi:hypothetical protein